MRTRALSCGDNVLSDRAWVASATALEALPALRAADAASAGGGAAAAGKKTAEPSSNAASKAGLMDIPSTKPSTQRTCPPKWANAGQDVNVADQANPGPPLGGTP